jgi:replicative DNA helicase
MYNQLSEVQMQTITSEKNKFHNLPIYIDDTPSLTVQMLRSRARRLKRQKKLKMIMVDYLQLLRSGSKQENKTQEISEITRELKSIAKELNIPVIALSQLSRQVESREDKKPMLQDLRESGSIEQDADIVMFIYREAYYLERTKPDDNNLSSWFDFDKWNDKKNDAEVIIAKHRNGSVGTTMLHFNAELTKFSDKNSQD